LLSGCKAHLTTGDSFCKKQGLIAAPRVYQKQVCKFFVIAALRSGKKGKG
jgi:hypothetical protein